MSATIPIKPKPAPAKRVQAATIPKSVPMPIAAPEPEYYGEDTGVYRRLWTREEYYRAANEGWFEGQRVELIRGEVYRKVTQNPPHCTTIYVTAKIMEEAFGPDVYVRQQAPLPALEDSEPEPDILVAAGSWRDYTQRHPEAADTLLAIEVSDTTLRMDTGKKMALYAEAGIKEYWILNIKARTLIVYRNPIPKPDVPYGFGYDDVTTYSETETISPLAKPDIMLRVADLLPPITQPEKAAPKRKRKS